jgi:hypothetical protein
VKRSSWLNRHVRVNPVRERPRRSSYYEDPPYLDHLRLRPCGVARVLGPGAGPCSPGCDPEHRRRGAGMGQTSPDPQAWACCRLHHDNRHDYTGPFKGWSGDQVDDFVDERIAEEQLIYYGRALDAGDLELVRVTAEAGRPTRGLFLTAAERRVEAL